MLDLLLCTTLAGVICSARPLAQGEGQSEVARSMGITRQALNRRLERASKRLRLLDPSARELLADLA
jgi:DNA-binding phage protein